MAEARIAVGTWRTLALLGFAVALLKGWRLPILWAATQAQVDYSQGFVKRGLLGEVAHLLHLPLGRYLVFYAVSYLLFVLLVLLMLRLIERAGLLGNAGGMALVALFGGSYGVTYLFSLVGYLDIILLILAVMVLNISHRTAQMAAALVLGVVASCVHELYALACFPVTLLPLVLAWARGERNLAAMLLGALALLAVLATVIALAGATPLSDAGIDALEASILTRVDFPIRSDFFDVLRRSAADNLAAMAAFRTSTSWWIDQIAACLAFVPAGVVFFAASWRVGAPAAGLSRRVLAGGALLVCCVAPLGLNLLGWDVYRWYALAEIASFLTLAIAATEGDFASLSLSRRWETIILCIFCLNLATTVGLISLEHGSMFPFRDMIAHLWDGGGAGLIHAPDL
jgi:hypothetical protein